MLSSLKELLFTMSGRPTPLATTEVHGIKKNLLERLGKEAKTAAKKIANPSYWHNVGYIEMQAVHEIQNCIDSLPTSKSKLAFEKAAAKALEKLAEEWRRNPDDEDGYGVATVHAVGSVLKHYRAL